MAFNERSALFLVHLVSSDNRRSLNSKYGEGGLEDVPCSPPAMSPGFLCLTDHQHGRCGTHYQRYHHVVIYTAVPQLQIIVHHFRLFLDDIHDLTTQTSLANIHLS